jgi:hypothetical protein
MKKIAKVFLILFLFITVGVTIFLLRHPQMLPSQPPSVPPPGSSPTSPPGPAPKGLPPGVFLVNNQKPWTPDKGYVIQEFFGYMSTADAAPPHANGAGLDILGRYCECGAENVVKEAAFKSAEDLQRFPLTFRAGHPYYTSSRNGDLDSFGRLRGGSWAAHVKGCSVGLEPTALHAEDSVLLVETDAASGRRPIVHLSGDVRLRGIVVRRGGILLIDDALTMLRVNFILVETGGVLQAGAATDGYRYKSRLSIILTHPPSGYGTMPVVASQCPYHVYAPGVQWVHESETCPTGNCPKVSGFDGTSMCFTNAFAAKTLAVGFNGTCALFGQATPQVPYRGTWRSLEADGDTTRTNGRNSLSIGDDQKLLDASYRLCWARLAPGSGVQNGTSVELHPEDTTGLSLDDIARVYSGAQILITSSTEEFSNRSHPSGMSPLYISPKDNEDPGGNNVSQNKRALTDSSASFVDPSRGVEVAVVSRVTQVGATFVLNLRDALQLDHSLQPVQLTRSGESVTVETTHHVGLLSHNITVDGQDLQSQALRGGAGCNNYTSDPSAPEAMGLGISNQTHAQLMGMKSVRGTEKVSSCTFSETPGGSGGAVTFNYAKSARNKNENITGQCYENFDRACVAKLTGDSRPRSGADLVGSWLFGTARASGCNSIFGGTCMFRYGSSALLDSVELVRMGIAPNFGSLGQYAIHFHLFGFAKSFKGYLPADASSAYSRDAAVRNCSIWRSYSRFVTLHGACEVDVCNNVCAVGFGSGFFVEDGTELLNVFQHNLACCVFPCVPNEYFNPHGIMPNVSTDICQLSLFWLKNNLNAVARNVGCCCPGNTTFVWYVPQLVGQLRGPSSVCMGSEVYALPACGSMASINGPNGLTSAAQAVNNNKGNIVKFKTGLNCGSESCACWVPKDFKFPFLDPTTGCISYTSNNTLTPVFLHAENVGYCLPVFHSEFPEGINGGPQTLGAAGCGGSSGAQGCTWYFQDSKGQPQFMPANGQNACTDSYVGTYPEHQWLLENFLPQPLTADQMSQANASCAQWTLDGLQSNMLPKIFSGVLTFNLGASSGLWGGAGWVKAVPPILIDCCFLETSTRISKKVARPDMGVGNGNLSWGWAYPQTSSFFASSTSTGTNDFPNLYTVLHNFMTNSAISISSNVTVISGKKTFFDTQTATLAVGGESSGAENATLAIAVFDNDLETLFGTGIWKTFVFTVSNQLQLFEYTTHNYYTCSNPGDKPVLKGTFQSPPQGSWPAAPFKYPYVCGPHGLLTTEDASPTSFSNFQWLNGVVANATTAQFQTSAAKAAGNDICASLKDTWHNLPFVDKNGQRSAKLNPPSGWNLSPACAVPSKFLNRVSENS